MVAHRLDARQAACSQGRDRVLAPGPLILLAILNAIPGRF